MNNYAQLLKHIEENAEQLSANGKRSDNENTFAIENYRFLQSIKFFSAQVPIELGGGGVSYQEMANIIKTLATIHPSTALSSAMHQHIVSANCFNYLHHKPGKALLEKLVADECILVSTGAGDWLASNGELIKTDGGYYLTATKHFASGCVAGDILVTSAPYHDPELGWQVFHFPLPMKNSGITILDNWYPMGMKGTGSNSVQIEHVFIPETAIALKRPRGDYHAVWCVVLPVALPLIMSAYVGIAESAAKQARSLSANFKDAVTPYILGEMENELTTAQVLLNNMLANVNEFNFTPNMATLNEVVKRKTIVANACKNTVNKAMEACGGPGYLASFGIECLLRDVMASHFHPMQEKRQHLLTGYMAVGKEPPSQVF